MPGDRSPWDSSETEQSNRGVLPFDTSYFDSWINAYSPQAAQNLWQQSWAPKYEQAWQSIQPDIESAFAGPGYYSKARGQAIERAKGELETQKAGAYGNLMFQQDMMQREALGRRAQLMAYLQEQERARAWDEKMWRAQVAESHQAAQRGY